LKKSLEEYELALEIDPNNYWAALGLGNLYLYELNDLDQAKACLLCAVRINPAEWYAYYSLYALFCRQGDDQAAQIAYEEATRRKQTADPARHTDQFFSPPLKK